MAMKYLQTLQIRNITHNDVNTHFGDTQAQQQFHYVSSKYSNIYLLRITDLKLRANRKCRIKNGTSRKLKVSKLTSAKRGDTKDVEVLRNADKTQHNEAFVAGKTGLNAPETKLKKIKSVSYTHLTLPTILRV